MYCYRCDEEFPPRARFCKTCGDALVEREAEQLKADLGRVSYLLEELAGWERQGLVPESLAAELARPYRKRAGHLDAALEARSAAEAPAAAAPLTPNPVSEPTQATVHAAPAESPESPAPLEPEPPIAVESWGAEAPEAGTAAVAQAAAPSEAFPASETSGQVLETSLQAEEAEAPKAPSQPEPEGEVRAAAEIGSTLLAAAVLEPVEAAEHPLDEQQQLIERESPWSSVWKPFLYENVGWFVGAFLLLSGSFYFVAESQGVARTLLVTGLLAAYATGFWFGGRHLAGRGLTLAGRVLASISGALAPLVVLAAAPLRGESRALWVAVTLASLLGMGALVRACATVFDRGRAGSIALAAGALLGLFAFEPIAPSPLALALADAAGLATLWWLAPSLRELRRDEGLASFAGIGLGYFGAALFIRAHVLAAALGAPLGLAHYGPLLVALVALVLRAEEALFERRESPSWLALLAYALLAPAALASTSDRLSFALACALGTLLLARGARHYRSAVFTFLALSAGWIAWHAASGFFRAEWLLALRDGIKGISGYGPGGKLPWNYGGLASLGYLALVAVAYARVRAAQADWARGAFRVFSIGLAILLLGWGHLGTDLRPALLTAAIVAAGALVCSLRFDHPRLAWLSAASGLLAAADAALVLRIDFVHAQGGAAAGALALVTVGLLLEARRARAFKVIAAVGALAAACFLPASGTGADAAAASALTAAALLAAAFASRSALFSFPGLASAVWALGLALVRIAHLSPEQLPPIGMLLGIALLLASGLEARASAPGVEPLLHLPLPARGMDVLREPLRHVGRLCTWLALGYGIDGRHGAALFGLFALASLLLARRQAKSRHLHAAAIAGALAVAIAVDESLGNIQWVPALAAVGFAYSLLALLLSRSARLSQAALRLSPERASGPFALHVAMLSLVAMAYTLNVWTPDPTGVRSSALAVASLFVTARSRRSSRWLYPATAAATLAVGALFPFRALPLVLVAAAHASLALALLARRRPRVAQLLFGIDQLERPFARLAHLHAGAALLATVWLAGHGGIDVALALPAALFSLLYLFAARFERRPAWLGVAAVAAWGALAAGRSPQPAIELLAWSGAAAVLLGAIARARPAFASGAVLAPARAVATVLAGTGLGMAAAACLAGVWNEPLSQATWALAGASAALFLAPRVFRHPAFLAGSAAAAFFALASGGGIPMGVLAGCFAAGAMAAGALANAFRRVGGRILGCGANGAAWSFGFVGLAAAVGAWALPAGGARAQAVALVAFGLAVAPRIFGVAWFLAAAGASGTLAVALAVDGRHEQLAVAVSGVILGALAVFFHRFGRLAERAFALEGERAGQVAPSLAATGVAAAAGAIAMLVHDGSGLAPAAVVVGLGAATAALGFAATGWRALIPAAAAAFVAALACAPGRFEYGFLAGLGGVNLLLWLCGPAGQSRFDGLLVLLERHGTKVRAGEGLGSPSSSAHSTLLGTTVVAVALGTFFLSALALARWIAFALGLDPALAVAMVGAQAATAWHLLRRHAAPVSWHLALLTVGAGIWLLGGREGLPYAASAAAVLLAVLESVVERGGREQLLERLGLGAGRFERTQLANLLGAYGIAFAAAGLLGTEGDPALLATPVALALVAAASAVRAAGGSAISRDALILLVPLALHYALFYAGIRISTGRPRETILPFLSLAMTLASLGAEQLSRGLGERPGARRAIGAAHLYAALAAIEWSAGLGLVGYLGSELLVSSLAALGVTAFYLRRAHASGSSVCGYAGFASFLALYLSVRLQTSWMGPQGLRSDADALAGLLFGFLFLGVHAALRRLELPALAEPARRLALVLPVLGALTLEPQANPTNALLLFGLALQLATLSAVEGRGALSGTLAAIAFNLALATVWLQAGMREARDAQYYAIPAGATLVLLAHLFRRELKAEWRARLRTVGILGIYVSSAWPALTSFGNPSHVLWCALLCVVGIAAGIALRVRIYLYVGTAFLVTCVVGNMVRFGLREHTAGAAFLTLLGLLVVGFMIFFTARREELLRRYREVQAMLAEWQ